MLATGRKAISVIGSTIRSFSVTKRVVVEIGKAKLSHIAIYSRFVGVEEATHQFKLIQGE